MEKITTLLLVIASLFCFAGYAEEIQEVKEGHIHEAFMTIEQQYPLHTAIPRQPPRPLNENIPPQQDSQTIWIPGYWEWSTNRNDFVWCSGTWRRPPSRHIWIEGRWQRVEEGWIRLKGFWSETPFANLHYLPIAPPDRFNEHPSEKPGPDFFWMSGYWSYQQGNYTWLSGQWERLDRDWVYVPARYVWRPEGYVFIPAFWDWPLEVRGTAFACVSIPRNQSTIYYTPSIALEPLVIIERCILIYPDYYYCFCHHYNFHRDWWWDHSWCPPWWVWGWWWLPCEDHWALWWWWCHPGYPAPDWLSHDAIRVLFAPPYDLVAAMEKVHPPLFVTPLGVVSPSDLLDVLGGPQSAPVFPFNPKNLQNEAGSKNESGNTETPMGQKIPLGELEDHFQPLPLTTPLPPLGAKLGKQPQLPQIPMVQPPPKPSIPAEPVGPTFPTQPIEPPRQVEPPVEHILPPKQFHPLERPIRPLQPPTNLSPKPKMPKQPSPTYPRPSTPNWNLHFQPQGTQTFPPRTAPHDRNTKKLIK